MRAKPVTEFKRRKRRPKVKFKVEDINYKNVELLKNFMKNLSCESNRIRS